MDPSCKISVFQNAVVTCTGSWYITQVVPFVCSSKARVVCAIRRIPNTVSLRASFLDHPPRVSSVTQFSSTLITFRFYTDYGQPTGYALDLIAAI